MSEPIDDEYGDEGEDVLNQSLQESLVNSSIVSRVASHHPLSVDEEVEKEA